MIQIATDGKESSRIEFGSEERPIPDWHKNQWRYLPQFCVGHFDDLEWMGGVRRDYKSFHNPKWLFCDVMGCSEPAKWQERGLSRKDMGELVNEPGA